MALLQPNALLIGVWLQMFGTGAYFAYLPKCYQILRDKHRQDGLSLFLPVACIAIFLITTADVVVEMTRAYQAYSIAPGKVVDPAAFYRHAGTPLAVTKGALTGVLQFISDTIMVYRTWVIWNGNIPIILVPAGLCLAATAVGSWSIWTQSQTNSPNSGVLIFAAVSERVRYFFILTFVLNALCALLICYRIWSISKRTHSHNFRESPTRRVIFIISESAVIYCAFVFVCIVCTSVGSNIFFIFLEAVRLPSLLPYLPAQALTRHAPPPAPPSDRANLHDARPPLEAERPQHGLGSNLASIRFRSTAGRPDGLTSRGGGAPIEVGIDLQRTTHIDRVQHPYAMTDDIPRSPLKEDSNYAV
ncbi:uncharacterized protein BXZ73DRAFT_105501 [Epithele typhae]|uniref:uncharacterized protein n=1 Tax=Epithele typhae TaxID=378194 RepID=UPI0020077BDB|nr:uncharacterized protein BXZ73DRAFT_105501 [Epithele typhae]KAH9917677.1 hypothetical protein BXZ73DRAFT_105501 [Epithele typhae]